MYRKASEAVRKLRSQEKKVSIVESCTGGMISEYITSIKGASSVFELGFVLYSELQKVRFLKLSPSYFKQHDVYSEAAALVMAKAMKDVSGSDVSVATTGIADVGPSVAKNRVGEIYVALFGKKGYVQSLKLKGSRNEIRRKATEAALDMIINWEDNS